MTRTQLAAVSIALIASAASAPSSRAQDDSGTPMLGAWELSNAVRDKTCTINFKLDPVGPARGLEFQ